MIELDAWPDKNDLKRRAPLAAVCSALGVSIDQNGFGLCPFHESDGSKHRPSFNLWTADDGTQRWGCFPCGLNGDVFDLVQRVRLVSFGEALRYVAEVVREAPPWEPAAPRAELDAGVLRVYIEGAQGRARTRENDGLLCVATHLRDEREPLSERLAADARLRELGWGVDDRANVVIPHYKRSLEYSGAKIRTVDRQKWSFPGSRFEELYGWQRPNVSRWKRCLICEGETDYAHVVLSVVPAYVLALPTGAASFKDEWLKQLSQFETVFMALDGDEAGDRGLEVWRQNLAIFRGVIETRVLDIPRGEDLRSCGTPVIELMEAAWTAM